MTTRRILAWALAASLAASCSSSEVAEPAPSTTGAPSHGGELVVGLTGESDGFNPITSRFSNSTFQVARALMDPLVVFDHDGEWRPYLAESLEPNADFTEWTIRLRPGIRFHNGEPLDAAALALFLDAVTKSPLTATGLPDIPVIAAVDDLTVRLAFAAPWSGLPAYLADQPGYVIAPEQVDSGETDHAIGTGPFRFESWTPDATLTASRNPEYWRDGLPYLDHIEFRVLPDSVAREQALVTGGIDVADLIAAGAAEELAGQGYPVVDDVDVKSTSAVILNLDADQVSDRQVREALVRAVDRDAFVEIVTDGHGIAADQPYVPTSPWHAEVDYPRYAPDAARRLVDEYEQDHGAIELEMIMIAGATFEQGAQFLQESWASVGVDLSVDSLEITAYIRRFISGEYDAAYPGAFFGAADPDGLAQFLHSDNADGLIKLNFARHRSEVVDDAIRAERAIDDPEERAEEFARIWQALAADLPYIFLGSSGPTLVTAPDVAGFSSFTTPEGEELPAINRWAWFLTGVYRMGAGPSE